MAAGLLCLAHTAPAAAQENPPVPDGVWMKPNGKAAVELYLCEGEKLCGRLMWARPSEYPEGQRRDIRNPDPSLRDRDLCGAVIIWGLEYAGDGQWEDGWVYDPSRGRTFNAELTIQGPDDLKVRGYKYTTLLGKTQDWVPAPADLDLCTRPLTASR